MPEGLDAVLDDMMNQVDLGEGDDQPAEGGESESEEPEGDTGEEPEQPESEEQEDETEDGDEPAEDEDSDEDDEDGSEQPDDGDGDLDSEATYRLHDGTEVTGKELGDGYLRQSDYTKKTQQLSAQRKKVEQREQQITEWLQQVRDDPANAVLEVASSSNEPVGTIAGALAADGNATGNAALLLRTLADQGQLSQEFIDHFGIETSGPVSQQAEQAEKDTRIDRLEKREQQREQDRQRQQIMDQYHQEWESVKSESSLDFSNDDESQAKIEVMQFARDRQIPSLRDAYTLMRSEGAGFAGRQAEQSQQRQQEARKKASQTVEKKKKRANAQNRRGSGQGTSKASSAPHSLDGAISQAMQEHGV